MEEVLLQVKVKHPLADEIDKVIESGFYSTRTEFLRDAIRKMILSLRAEIDMRELDRIRKEIVKDSKRKPVELTDAEKDQLVVEFLQENGLKVPQELLKRVRKK